MSEENNNWGDDMWPLILLLFAMENPNYPLPEPMHLYNPDLAPQTKNMDDKYPHIPIRPELTNPHNLRADQVVFDEFTIDQLRKATMNKKEAEKTRLDMLREAYEKGLDDYNGFTGLYSFGKDDDS